MIFCTLSVVIHFSVVEDVTKTVIGSKWQRSSSDNTGLRGLWSCRSSLDRRIPTIGRATGVWQYLHTPRLCKTYRSKSPLEPKVTTVSRARCRPTNSLDLLRLLPFSFPLTSQLSSSPSTRSNPSRRYQTPQKVPYTDLLPQRRPTRS